LSEAFLKEGKRVARVQKNDGFDYQVFCSIISVLLSERRRTDERGLKISAQIIKLEQCVFGSAFFN
jgi:hypothetical protein